MCSQHYDKVWKPQNFGGRDKMVSTGGLGLHLLILPPSSCPQLQSKCKEEFLERLTSNRSVHPSTQFSPALQSCPFFLKFKKLLKKPIIEACIKVVISPQIRGEIHRASTAKQSTLWTGTHALIRQEQTPPFLLYVLSLISPSKSLQECD